MAAQVSTRSMTGHLVGVGLYAASGALVGALGTLTAPVGALFGATHYCIATVITAGSETAKTNWVAQFIFTGLAETFAMAAMGFSMTFGSIVLLQIVTAFALEPIRVFALGLLKLAGHVVEAPAQAPQLPAYDAVVARAE